MSEQQIRKDRQDAETAVRDIVQREEAEVEKMRVRMEARSERAHERLENRKRKRLSALTLRPNVSSDSSASATYPGSFKSQPVETSQRHEKMPRAKGRQKQQMWHRLAAVSLCAFAFRLELLHEFGFKLRQRKSERHNDSFSTDELALLHGFSGVASKLMRLIQRRTQAGGV